MIEPEQSTSVDDDYHECRRCHELFELTGLRTEPTELCDCCAQEEVERLRRALRKIAALRMARRMTIIDRYEKSFSIAEEAIAQ